MAAAFPMIAAEGGLSRYLAEIRRFPMLDPAEEYMLAKRWRECSRRACAISCPSTTANSSLLSAKVCKRPVYTTTLPPGMQNALI